MSYLGIAGELKPKIKLTMGGDAAAQAAASGAAQIAVAQRRNFIASSGTQMLQPLPACRGSNSSWRPVSSRMRQPEAAMALAKFLSSPARAAVIRAKGMEPDT